MDEDYTPLEALQGFLVIAAVVLVLYGICSLAA